MAERDASQCYLKVGGKEIILKGLKTLPNYYFNKFAKMYNSSSLLLVFHRLCVKEMEARKFWVCTLLVQTLVK